jgi:hypothetical protein
VGERTFGNIILRGPESQLIRQVIESLDLGKLSVFKNVSIERGIRKPSVGIMVAVSSTTANGYYGAATVAPVLLFCLHFSCPI